MSEVPQYETDVSDSFPFTLHEVSVLGSQIAHVDTGKPQDSDTSGITAVFLHGNASSSYTWRNIIPHVSPMMRCVAPDLIGAGSFGQSGTLDLPLHRSLHLCVSVHEGCCSFATDSLRAARLGLRARVALGIPTSYGSLLKHPGSCGRFCPDEVRSSIPYLRGSRSCGPGMLRSL